MLKLKDYEIWFVTGSQHLYGPETLKQVEVNSREIVNGLNASGNIPLNVVFKKVLTTPEAIRNLLTEANADLRCAGVVMWMHTFSPAKMWMAGLRILSKPFVHLHTQFNVEIPWDTIDMNFMNLNQSAHGDREFGYIATRMGKRRKVIVGHWKDGAVQKSLAVWSRAAVAWHDMQGARIARFGDNMRQVAVTEGDKVEAELRFGYSVDGYGVGDLVKCVNAATEAEVDKLIGEYFDRYRVSDEAKVHGARYQNLRDGARIELGLRNFLEEGGFKGFTTTFEDLHGLKQLPGIAVQRLMSEGYGFGAEGDWKTAALVRAMKVMSDGMPGGTSFMEDYTYHMDPRGMKVLGAHMLEICESIASGKPSLEIHPLSIGGREDPPRLVFNVDEGPAINATIVDLGSRFRLVVNEVDVVAPDRALPKLPVARAVWRPRPDLAVAAASWIHAGGAHHTGFSRALTAENMEDFAEIAGIEYVKIGGDTTVAGFRRELRWNEAYFRHETGQ